MYQLSRITEIIYVKNTCSVQIIKDVVSASGESSRSTNMGCEASPPQSPMRFDTPVPPMRDPGLRIAIVFG